MKKNSKIVKAHPKLSKVGIGVEWLISSLKEIEADFDTQTIFLSIGVNDAYQDKGIKTLVQGLINKFPNAYFFVIKGSYGWGNVMNITPSSIPYQNYYKKFPKDFFIISNQIGYGAPPHQQKKEYYRLGYIVDCIILKSEGYKCSI